MNVERKPQRLTRRQAGFSLVELLIVIAIILIIAGIAVPKYNKVQMHAKEMAAIREIGSIHQAETQYYSQYNRYANSLAELGPPASGASSATAADLLPKSLAEGESGGYTYEVKAVPSGYTINANPRTFGTSGERTFFSDQTMVIRENRTNEPATTNSKAINDKK